MSNRILISPTTENIPGTLTVTYQAANMIKRLGRYKLDPDTQFSKGIEQRHRHIF